MNAIFIFLVTESGSSTHTILKAELVDQKSELYFPESTVVATPALME